MDQNEIRLRLIEAAARAPMAHPDGFSAGVVATAEQWLRFVAPLDGPAAKDPRGTLGLPKK